MPRVVMTRGVFYIDWNAEVAMTLQAWAGAKVEILGYELAEWSTRFDIAGPWQILKIPAE